MPNGTTGHGPPPSSSFSSSARWRSPGGCCRGGGCDEAEGRGAVAERLVQGQPRPSQRLADGPGEHRARHHRAERLRQDPLRPLPEPLLMDEPASALDPIATARIEELIRELRESLTIVIVTHNMQQAARVSDSTAFFYMGELIEHGPTEQIFTNPRESRTEDYVTGKFG